MNRSNDPAAANACSSDVLTEALGLRTIDALPCG